MTEPQFRKGDRVIDAELGPAEIKRATWDADKQRWYYMVKLDKTLEYPEYRNVGADWRVNLVPEEPSLPPRRFRWSQPVIHRIHGEGTIISVGGREAAKDGGVPFYLLYIGGYRPGVDEYDDKKIVGVREDELEPIPKPVGA